VASEARRIEMKKYIKPGYEMKKNMKSGYEIDLRKWLLKGE
jgi:hypothetical protein